MTSSAPLQTSSRPSFGDLVAVFFKIGCLSFGGPAGQIALMHKMLVEEAGWIDEREYFGALNFCTLLPGPEAMQLATYVGWRLHGVKGGLASGLLFVVPGAAVMMILGLLYAVFGSGAVGQALLLGVKAAVLAIVLEALMRIAKRGLTSALDRALALVAFVAIYVFGVPFPVIILLAGLIGYVVGQQSPDGARAIASSTVPVPVRETVKTVALWLVVWIAPLLAIAAAFGTDHVLSQMALFFSKLAVVTFGGAYAVLAYMGQEVVQSLRWLAAGEMVDALGLAETTPGPLILVTEFVGVLAAYRHGGSGSPLLMGLLGGLVALWATFAPCFLWIFAGAPYVDRLNSAPALRSALQAVTAAVVGVILNLTLWFLWHVLFRQVDTIVRFPAKFSWPAWASLDITALAVAAFALVLMFRLHRGIIETLGVCAAAALVLRFGLGL